VNMLLLDWTRMGRLYCLAGAIYEDGHYRIVRPLLARNREAEGRITGWSPYQVDGHSRWEFFELVGAEPATREPPHVEDLWVRSMESHRCLASRELRVAVLNATVAKAGEPFFGERLTATRAAAYLKPGTGARSLATLIVSGREITFHANLREGEPEPDVRVKLHVPGLESRFLPVKDHHLLCRAEQGNTGLQEMLQTLNEAVASMGDRVAVRLGLSRAFSPRPDCEGFCWLMADGFFSLADPQP